MKIIPLVVSISIANLAGIIGSIFTSASLQAWYANLIVPSWNPPGWVFGPVWITLYTLMGIAAYIIWRRGGDKVALRVYGIQLVLNSVWSILFFGLQNPGLAFVEIILLLIFILVTAFLFYRINKWAGILLLPYILWVSFATFLNYTIWQLN